jgi:hypothetical protein
MAGDKINLDELITNHLNSIGTAEARAAVTSRNAQGILTALFKLGWTGQLQGPGIIASEGNKNCIAVQFGHPEYPGEHIAYDGNKVTVAVRRPGMRSPLTQILYENNKIIKQGLLGGTLMTSWFLNDRGKSNIKLDYKGLKKVGNRELHVVECGVRGERYLKVQIFFQPDSFNHVMTKYVITIPEVEEENMLSSEAARDNHMRITETFDQFKKVDGLTFPHLYKVTITTDQATDEGYFADYIFVVTKIIQNEAINPATFVVTPQ